MQSLIKDTLRPIFHLTKKIIGGKFSLKELAYSRDFQFSQFGEDAFLRSQFASKTKGFYVDVGAYHPYQGSNTYTFYSKGWRGINVEPNPVMFSSFKRYREKDTNLNVAVSLCSEPVTFHCDGVYSSIVDSKTTNLSGKIIQVPAITLSDLLDQHVPAGMPIDFLSVDSEGHDLAVVQSGNWEKYRPKFVLIEDESSVESTPVDQFMKEINYQFCCQLGMTKVFINQD